MNFKGVKRFSLSVLAGVAIGIILHFFIPGIPNLGQLIYENRIRGDMMRELKSEAGHNGAVFYAAMNNEEQMKKTMKLELPMRADCAALESLLNDKRKFFDINDGDVWLTLKKYYDESMKFNAANREWKIQYAKKRESKLVMDYKKTYGKYLDMLNREYEAVLETAAKNGNNFRFPSSALPEHDRGMGFLYSKLMAYNAMVGFENAGKAKSE